MVGNLEVILQVSCGRRRIGVIRLLFYGGGGEGSLGVGSVLVSPLLAIRVVVRVRFFHDELKQ